MQQHTMAVPVERHPMTVTTTVIHTAQTAPNSATQDGYMYYLCTATGQVARPLTRDTQLTTVPPPQFGFDWENIEGVTPTGNAAYYPYHYWGYYYNSYHGGAAGTTFAPPEGYVGYVWIVTTSVLIMHTHIT